MTSRSFFLSFVLIFAPLSLRAAEIKVVEIVPATQFDYTVSSELKQIEVSSGMGLTKAHEIFPSCSLRLTKDLGRGSESDLAKVIESMGKAKDVDQSMVIGLSRSNFARVAAKAAAGSGLRALSIGASTSQLASINSNFLSIVSPWENQWSAIQERMSKEKCQASGTVGYFDYMDQLSSGFKNVFSTAYDAQNTYSFSGVGPGGIRVKPAVRCVFFGVNFSRAQVALAKLVREHPGLKIFGVGDWNYYSKEIIATLKGLSGRVEVFAPTGWVPKLSPRSAAFSLQVGKMLNEAPSPVAAYTYDAVLISAFELCTKFNLSSGTLGRLNKLPLLRHYEGITAGGNLESKMNLVTFGGKTGGN